MSPPDAPAPSCAHQHRGSPRAKLVLYCYVPIMRRGVLFGTLQGVPVRACVRVRVKAFRMKALEHHPDKGGDDAMFRAVQDAYNALTGKAGSQLDQG
jgi:hypothetical protein